jgi:DNA-binding transcriptional LysR family regulator
MMETMTPTWDDLRVLLALHRNRSFLAAGKALGVSTSTAARRVEALEQALGRPLVHRSSEGTSVEPGAMELVSLAEQLELGLAAARRNESDAAEGSVRITMGEGFIVPVTRALSQLRRMHPSLRLEILSELRTVDLARREADIGIRKVRSNSPVLIERKVGTLTFSLYASAEYVERRARDARVNRGDFARHDFIGFDRSQSKLPQALWLVEHGAERFTVASNSDAAIVEATLAGQGLSVLADAYAKTQPGLIRLNCEVPTPTTPIYLVFHKELRNVPRVRVVIDALREGLEAGLA